MGVKYTTILSGGVVSTYNDDAPADDGSQTADNRIRYSRIESDLTHPLHSAITKIDSRITAMLDEGPDIHSTTYTTVASDYAKVLECEGTFTLSLLDPSGQAGYHTTVKNAGSGTITVDVDGGALVDGFSSITLPAGNSGKFRVNAGATAYYSEARANLNTLGYGEIIGILEAFDLV